MNSDRKFQKLNSLKHECSIDSCDSFQLLKVTSMRKGACGTSAQYWSKKLPDEVTVARTREKQKIFHSFSIHADITVEIICMNRLKTPTFHFQNLTISIGNIFRVLAVSWKCKLQEIFDVGGRCLSATKSREFINQATKRKGCGRE